MIKIRQLSEKNKETIEMALMSIKDADILAKIKQEGNEKHFEIDGFPCAILRCGVYLCGYVGLPKGHRNYEEYHRDIDVNVHGGLTFSGQDGDFWVIGFDCAHARDYFGGIAWLENKMYRDMEYVESEIKSLIEQLK